jgi:glycosyltransferase involved in cell wall biosynthesis
MRGAPVRVLHLRDSPWVDGPGRTIVETAARIDRARIDYQVGVFVPAEGVGHPLIEAIRRRGQPVHAIVDDGSSLAAVVDRVTALATSLRTEILHTSEFRSNAIGLLCRRRLPMLKLVSTAHGWIANELRGKVKSLLDRLLLRLFERVIVVSHAVRGRLPGWWITDRRARVIHNALPFESFDRGPAAGPRRAPPSSGPVRLLAVGRLSPEKGFDLLLTALAEVARDFPAIELSIAGTGALAEAIAAQAERLGLTNKVKMLGYVNDMTDIYHQADLVVQSSLTEGLPNVMLEVAYLGVPVLATDVGGTREVIEHGVNGWLVRPGSAAEIAAGIRRYLAQPAQFIEMARRGRQRVVE